MTLFIENILTNVSPSTIDIMYQDRENFTFSHLMGLLTSEPTLSTSVKWGPILNDVTNLQDVASLLGSQSMWTWIGASTMCWKGTDPIKTSIEFYLINYRPNLGIEDSLRKLNYFTSLEKDGMATVYVHGGYGAQVLETNSKLFNNHLSSVRDISGNQSLGEIGMNGLDQKGTLMIKLGNKILLTKMLISRLDVTPSLVEVPDKKPLYYKVSMSLIGTQPLLSTDVDNMYTGGRQTSSVGIGSGTAGKTKVEVDFGGGSSW